MVKSKNKPANTTSLGGRIGTTLFGLIFCAIPLFISTMIVRETLDNYQTRRWTPTPCQIEISQVETAKENYRPKIDYLYRVRGQDYQSDRIRLRPPAFADYHKAQQLVDRFPTGITATCFVNPTNPNEAVLEHGSLSIIFTLLFCLPFLAVGIGIIWFSWFRLKNSPNKPGKPSHPQSLTQKSSAGRRTLALFFSFFLLMGLGFTYGMFLHPLLNYLGSSDWVATPCVIESSRVQSHSGEDSTTYSVDILYRYTIDGRNYKSNRYDFKSGSTSGHAKHAAIARQYPVGSPATCFVDPDDPRDAVLVRSWTRDLGFIFIPLIFVAVGAGGVWFSLRTGRPMRPRHNQNDYQQTVRSDDYWSHDNYRHQDNFLARQPLTLSCAGARLKAAVMFLVFALFWNGFISIIVTIVVKSHLDGRPEWFLTIFIIPFVLIGLILITLLLHSFLALFNSAIRVTLDPAPLRLGTPLELAWEIDRPSNRLKSLTLWLEGREEVTSSEGRGKRRHTSTVKAVFIRIDLAEERCDLVPIGPGRVRFAIPAELVPTLKCGNCRIIWELHVKGDVARWPDIHDKYPLTVLPAQEEASCN